MRHDFSWLKAHCSVVLQGGDGVMEWWTFAGSRTNATLARQLMEETDSKVNHDSFALTFEPGLKPQAIERALEAIRHHDIAEMRPVVECLAVDGLKFSECLPAKLALEMLEHRLQDQESTRRVIEEQVRFLIQ